jgi:hypothetical protein
MHEQITRFLKERIDSGDFPSAVYLVAEKGEIVFHDALGLAVVAGRGCSKTSAFQRASSVNGR